MKKTRLVVVIERSYGDNINLSDVIGTTRRSIKTALAPCTVTVVVAEIHEPQPTKP